MRWTLNERPDALQVFRDYLNIKLHFDGRFDWFPGMGQRITEKTLRDRKDSRFFTIVAEKAETRGEVVERLITAFLNNPDFWIGEYTHQEVEAQHGKRLSYIQSIRHKFSTEFENICVYMQTRDINLKKLLVNGGNPVIIRDRRNILGGVSDETLAIIEHFFKFCGRGETLNPLWERRRHIISRYSHLVIPGEKDFEFIEDLISKSWLN